MHKCPIQRISKNSSKNQSKGWASICPNLLNKDITKDELVEAVLSNFVDVSREQVSGDVDNFVKNLSDGGILE